MALDDKDREEIGKLIGEGLVKAFEVPEGKTLSQHLAGIAAGEANGIVNAWDKRTSKSRGALEEKLAEVTKELEELKAGGGGGGDDDDDPAGGKPDGLTPAVAKQIKALEKKAEDLARQLDEERKARQKSDDDRKAVEEQAAAARMRDEVQRISLGKDVGVDPERIEVMLDHLFGRGLIRAAEGGRGYEFQNGTDKYSGDPTWVPLSDGLKEFVKGSGKMFLPAVPGSGGDQDIKGRTGGGQQMGAEDFSKMSPSDIEKAAAEGRIQLGE